MMRGPLTGSLVLHGLVILLVTVALSRTPLPPKSDEPIAVDIVTLAERANAPVAKSPPAASAAPAAPSAPSAATPDARASPSRAAPPPEPAVRPKPSEPAPSPPPVAAKPAPSEAAPPPARPPSPAKPDRETAANEAPRPPKQPPPIASGAAKPELAEPAEAAVVPKAKANPEPPSKLPAVVAKPKTEVAAAADTKPQPAPERSMSRAEPAPPQKPQPAARQAVPPADRTRPDAPTRSAEVKPATATAKSPASKVEASSDFSAVAGAVAALKKQSPGTQAGPADAAPPGRNSTPAASSSGSFETQVASAVRSGGATRHDPSLPLSGTEIDAVRRQIEQCWNLPAHVSGANLVVTIRVEMNPNGTPRSAVVENEARMQGDAAFRTTAESAKRAVLNPRCHPFKLPADKFDRWRTMTLVFNPKDMV